MTRHPVTDHRARQFWVLAGAFAIAYVVVLVRTAWITDDAYISLRTVDNLVEGFGLRWNTAERVQSFSHPLWVLVLSALVTVTRELYLTTIVASIALSSSAFAFVLVAFSRSIAGVCAAGFTLLLAPGFVAYSTSGLENPLSFALVALFAFVFLRREPSPRRTLWLSVLASLLVVNRTDMAVLVAPAVAADVYRHRHWRSLALGALPAAAWFVFALVYYGFFLPNTAYSKLNTGIALGAYAKQGIHYIVDAARRESLLMVVIVAGTTAALLRRGGARMLAVGVLLYLLYLIRIGGDFMLGRLLTVPLLVAVAVALDADLFATRRLRWAVVAVVAALGLMTAGRTILSGTGYGRDARPGAYFQTHGVASERDYYFQSFGMLNGKPLSGKLGHNMARLRRAQQVGSVRLAMVGRAGEFGLLAGPGTHVIDSCALGDALMARLPMREHDWRIGHFYRDPPQGYLLSLATGENRIRDDGIRDFYRHILAITRGPLFSGQRWRAIVRANVGLLRPPGERGWHHATTDTDEYLQLVALDAGAMGPKILWGAASHHCDARNLGAAAPLLERLSTLPAPPDLDYVLETLRAADAALEADPEFAEALLRLLWKLEPARAEAAWGLAAVLYRTDRVEESIGLMKAAAAMGLDDAQKMLERLGVR